MIVERIAAKPSLAVTLALAIALSFPGSVWSQTYNARVVAVTPVAGAQSGAAVAGVLSAAAVVPSLPLDALGLTAAAPALSAPAAAPAALSAAAAAMAPAAASAVARPVSAPVVAPASSRAQLDAVSRVVDEPSARAGGIEIVSIGRRFDGSLAHGADVRAVPESGSMGRVGRSFHPTLPPSLSAPLSPASATATQRRMILSLYQVASVFAEQYAPLDMKKDRFQLDLKREYDEAKAAILADPKITTRQYQDLLAKLVASMRDYHVSISFNSTESSKLPFQVMGAGGRYYLSNIDREKLPLEAFPFQMGDEVVGFDGQLTADAVKAIAGGMTTNTKQTDLRMAELFLTNRRRARGDNDIPQGDALIVIRSKGQFYRVQMPWDYTPELVAQDVPARNAGLLEPEGMGGGAIAGAPAGGGFLSSMGRAIVAAVHPLVDLFSDIRAEASDNPFMIGARRSFVPRLGQVLWRSDDDSHFDAYIFKAKDGRKMGYIRIAAYDGDNKEVLEFAKVMARFQAETEALVIDQVSNPGGSLFYLYALASHLTDKPLVAPRHQLIIGEGEAQQSGEFLLKTLRDSQQSPEAKEKARQKAKEKKEKFSKRAEDAPTASGYPITAKFMGLMFRGAQYIVQQFNAGNRFTGLTHIGGVDDIDPAPKEEERFTKPILLLTNALDFSGGDFFPAIMQDNKRVTILGVRTAGAGGIVKPFAVGGFGIGRLAATSSLAQRANGQPIENLGVTPDIPYEITAKDLRTGFAQYRWAIQKALSGLVAPAK